MITIILFAIVLASSNAAVLPTQNSAQNLLSTGNQGQGPSLAQAMAVAATLGSTTNDDGPGALIQEAASDAKDKIADVADTVKDILTEGPSAVQDVVQDAASAVKDAAENAMDQVADTMSSIQESIAGDDQGTSGGAVSSMDDAASTPDAVDNDDGIVEVIDDIADAMDDAMENTKDMVEDAQETIKDAIEKRKDMAEEMIDDIVELHTGDDDDSVLGNDDIMDDVPVFDTDSDDINDDLDDDDSTFGFADAYDSTEDLDDNDANDDDADDKFDDAGESPLDTIVAFINSLKNDMGLQFDDDYPHGSSHDADDQSTDDDSAFQPNGISDSNDVDVDDEDDERVYQFINKMSKAQKYMNLIQSQAAHASAAQAGTCPMYPVTVGPNGDKVTVTTQNGCQIVIKLQGLSVTGVVGIDDNLTDKQGMKKSVEISYETES